MNNRSECGHHWAMGWAWRLAIFCALTLSGPALAQLPANSIGAACANLSQSIASGAFGIVRCDSTGAIPVTGTFSATLGGFAPTPDYTTLSATTANATVALPSGVVVVVYNNGATATGVKLGTSSTVASMTAGDIIQPGSWQAFTVGSNTQLAAITASGTNTLVLSGGAGLATGAGGGSSSGGGGGGAVTVADGADVAQGATTDAAATQGSTGTLSAKLRTVTAQLNTLATNTTSIATSALQTTGNTSLASIATNTTGAATAANQSTGNTSLSSIDTKTPALSGGRVPVDGSGVTQPISAASLPLPALAATSTKQPNFGAAGTSSADVLSVQGIASGTALGISAASLPLPTLAATSTKQSDGSQKTQIVDGSGAVIASTSNALNVQCANCSGSGASAADEASYTAGSSVFAPSGGFFQTTATTAPLTTGQQGLVQMTATRAFFTNLRNAAGAEAGVAAVPLQVSLANTATNATAVKVDGSAVTQPISATALPLPALASTSTLQSSQLTQETASAAALGTTGDSAYAGSGNTTTVGGLKGIYAAVTSAAAASIPACGASPCTTTIGNTGINVSTSAGDSRVIGCDSTAIYDASTSGSTQLVALSSSKVIYICGYTILAAGTVNVKLIYGTGTACATGSNNMTPAYQLTAQVGLVDSSATFRGLKNIASNELCINTSAGIAVQAIVYYTQI